MESIIGSGEFEDCFLLGRPVGFTGLIPDTGSGSIGSGSLGFCTDLGIGGGIFGLFGSCFFATGGKGGGCLRVLMCYLVQENVFKE